MGLNSTWATGIDVSVGNGNYDPAVKPVDFLAARATIGWNKDSRFRYYRDLWKDKPFFAYHYFWAAAPWKEQADNFLATIVGLDVDMVFWDYETKGNILTAKTAADSVTAMSYLRQQLGKPVGFYANRSTLAIAYKQAPGIKAFPLWFAQYPTDKDNFDNLPNIEPKYWPDFTAQVPYLLWQFASEKNWGNLLGKSYGLDSYSVDINCWRGTKEQMLSYLGLWDQTPEPPKPDLEARVEKLEKEARNHGWSI